MRTRLERGGRQHRHGSTAGAGEVMMAQNPFSANSARGSLRDAEHGTGPRPSPGRSRVPGDRHDEGPGPRFTLGRADQQVSADELLAHAAAMVRFVDVPVSVDAERCFGDPAEVTDFVEAVAGTGAAGCSMNSASCRSNHGRLQPSGWQQRPRPPPAGGDGPHGKADRTTPLPAPPRTSTRASPV